MLNGEDVHVKGDILNSWKEIADYLDRGIRTVQRWERDLHLPVRRPRGKRRSAVLAIRHEIDAWLGSLPQNSLAEPTPTNQHIISTRLSEDATLVYGNLRVMPARDFQRATMPRSLYIPCD
jgi:hypothetical protein